VAVQRRTDIFVWALYSSRFCQFPVFNRYPNDLVKFKQNGTACAFGCHTQPPFGVVKQVLNEEYTRCKKMTQIFAAFPSSLHRSVPAHCLPAKGHFYAPCWAQVLGCMDFARHGKSLFTRCGLTESRVTIAVIDGASGIGALQPANPIGAFSRRSHDLRASNGARTGLSISRNLACLSDGDAGRLDSVMNHAHLRILANPAIGHLCWRGGSQNA